MGGADSSATSKLRLTRTQVSTISFSDGYRCKKLPANFIQAQRDYFGAHTYELLEKPGEYCTPTDRDWRQRFSVNLLCLREDKEVSSALWLRVVPACDWAVLVMGGILSRTSSSTLYSSGLPSCLTAICYISKRPDCVSSYIYRTTFMTDNSNNKLN